MNSQQEEKPQGKWHNDLGTNFLEKLEKKESGICQFLAL